MDKVKKVKYIGPTGLDPNLGYVVCNTVISIPVEFHDKYFKDKRIKDPEEEPEEGGKEDPKPAKFKRSKKEDK